MVERPGAPEEILTTVTNRFS